MVGLGSLCGDHASEVARDLQHRLDLRARKDDRRDSWGVVGLILAAVLKDRRQVEEGRDVATGSGDRLESLDGTRRDDGDGQTAVGREALLQAEVVDVVLGGLDRETSGRGRRVDDDECIVDATDVLHHAGRCLVVRQGLHVTARRSREIRASPRRRLDDVGGIEPRRTLGGRRELATELTEHVVA